MEAPKEVNVQVKVHNRTVFMKLDTSLTVIDFLRDNAEKFGIAEPERFVINVPSVLDKSGHSRWLSQSTQLSSVYLSEGGCLLVKNHPHQINVVVADGSQDWFRKFDPQKKSRMETFQFDFDDIPLDLIPELKSQEGFLQKDTQYVFMCILILINGTKTSFYVNSSVSLNEQNVPHDGYLALVPFSQFMKTTVDQLRDPDLAGYMTKSSIKNGKTTPTKKRWTVLKDHFLYYFKSQQGAPSGVVPLEYYAAYVDQEDPLVVKLVPMLFEGRYDYGYISPDCKNTFLLKFDNQKILEEWFPKIAANCANYAGKSVFGLDLNTLMSRKSSMFSEIPEIAYKTFDYLKKHVDAEGLFRLSGSSSDVAMYKSMWETGIVVDYDKSKPDPHTVASLFKAWLRELPVPVLPSDKYDQYVSLDEKSTEEKLSALPKLLLELPTNNRKLVLELIKFAYQVSLNSEVNRMTPNNLAIVFGPNLLKRAGGGGPSLKEAADSTAVVSITEFMIAHQEELCKNIEDAGTPKRLSTNPGGFAYGYDSKKALPPPPSRKPAGSTSQSSPVLPPNSNRGSYGGAPLPMSVAQITASRSAMDRYRERGGSSDAILPQGSPGASPTPPNRQPLPQLPQQLPPQPPGSRKGISSSPLPPRVSRGDLPQPVGPEPTIRDVLKMLEDEIRKREELERRVEMLEGVLAEMGGK